MLVTSLLPIACVAPAVGQEKFPSHAPMRPLPAASKRPLEKGTTFFVDAAKGDDTNDGSVAKPWRTIQRGVHRLTPGATLYLRGGVYYEKVRPTRSGTAAAPIVIASYPGELAVIDGGLREFFESPESSWQPFKGGAEGEYVSTKVYANVDERKIPHQFLPGAWEPMWGIEDERPLALGHFGDSMVPLHGYRTIADLRSANEFMVDRKAGGDVGVYCGPGMWYNRATGRIHIRLAHHQLAGLGDRAYRGETDPRKLQLVVALGFGDAVLRVNGVRHVKIEGIILRGATGSPMIEVYGSQNVHLDHLTVYGGFPGLLVSASKDIRVTNCVFRGLAAPWSGRAQMKYFGTASYQIVFQNSQPVNENGELAYCEFTDDHDFAFLRYIKNLQFHHNFVDNFNDDGLECGPKLRSHSMFIYQNRIGACLGVFQQHETDKDEAPTGHDPRSGVYIFRNVFDQRAGVYYHLPAKADPTGVFLHAEGHFLSDHGGPVFPVMRVYHNTMLRRTPVFRDHFLFGLGNVGLNQTERDVFNNIFVQMDQVPGVKFIGAKQARELREGGNLLWGVKDGPGLKGDPFGKFRGTALFADSRKRYEPGWTTQDRVANPKFVRLSLDDASADLRLLADSPAVNSGQPVPKDWPDPLRDSDDGAPDIGALPLGAQVWGVGVNGRISLFGGAVVAK
ncbi:MAG: right-handed parallel beta-helix repeat-containing protein [Planctomycetaceae bacterium]|nr:right-handed parallel beta-helix repeat-containing protein [Planctomycetaceae bacterium]